VKAVHVRASVTRVCPGANAPRPADTIGDMATRLKAEPKHQRHARHGTRVVYGVVVDHKMWRLAAVFLQQLRDVQSMLPAVVFNTSALPAAADVAIAAFGARRVSLEPPMPVPSIFVHPLSLSHGGIPAWTKLALWSQVEFEKIIYLDVDVLLLGNIDHMASFPGDTFSPEVCNFPPCDESKTPAGINVGIMVIGPSLTRFGQLLEYTNRRAAHLELVASNSNLSFAYGRRWLGSAEQSFLREFWEDALNASIQEPNVQRRGWNWTYASYTEPRACERQHERWRKERARGETHSVSSPGVSAPPGTCEPGRVSVMSRRYNARPADCGRCPLESLRPLIVHYACTRKPHEEPRNNWLHLTWCRGRNDSVLCHPCLAEWTHKWYDAEDRMCDTLISAGATESWRTVGACADRPGARGRALAAHETHEPLL
jgi:hypothetical protein